MAEARGVEAVERALTILGCFNLGEVELSLAEISARTGFYKSTILRLAVSLDKFGYLIRAETGRYRIGPAAWSLGARYRRGFDLAEVMRPELKLLSDATGETASYYVREGDGRICLFRSEPVRSIFHSINEGERMPLDRGASGRVLAAFSGAESDWAEAVRQAGYAVSLGERDPEVAAIAAPVLSAAGRLMGAISVSGLITRFDESRHAVFLDALFRSQRRLADQVTS